MDKILSELVPKLEESLRFAEAKNSVLLALAGAGAVALLTFLSPGQVPPIWATGIWVAISFLAIASLVALVSFLPREDQEKILAARMTQPKPTDNLLFFGHLAKHNPSQLVHGLSTRYLGGSTEKSHQASPYEVDLASQAIVLARITVLKLKYFRLAAALMILAVVSAALVPLAIIVLSRK